MFGLKIEKRAAPSPEAEIGVPVLSIGIALFVGSILILAQGFSPLHVYWEMFFDGFVRAPAMTFAMIVTKAIPLILVGVGLTLAFKAGVWNIGAPGQMIVGAIAGTGIALFLPFDLPPLAHVVLIAIAGFAAGAGLAAVCAFLNSKIGLDMVISTLMMNYVALKLLEHLVFGPWQMPGVGFPYSAEFPASAQLPTIPGTRIHYPILVIGIIVAALIYLLVKRTKLGYEIRVFGENPKATDYAGISKSKIIMMVMIISGGLAGLAGVGEVTGIHHRLLHGVDGAGAVYAASYGYVAIIVAWLGRRSALGATLAALFIAWILVGGHAIQMALGLPFAMVSVILGLVLLGLTGGAILTQYKITAGMEK